MKTTNIDRSLRTILGAYDGNVYEKVWEATKQEPLNKQVQPPGYAEYLKPFLQSKLWSVNCVYVFIRTKKQFSYFKTLLFLIAGHILFEEKEDF